MSTTIDESFEDEVRAMLARRAGDVAEAVEGEVPPLPTGLRIPIDDARSWAGGRTRWLAVAAGVLLVAGALGLAARAGGEGDPETAGTTAATGTTDPTSATNEPRPLQLDPLPRGVNPVAGPILGLAPPAPTPEAASDAVVRTALGGEVGPDIPYSWLETALPTDRWASYRYPLVEVDGRAWPDPDPDARAGSVVARRDEAGWHVVAVTSRALDLRDVRRRGDGLAGAVWATSAAPLRVTVSTLDGELLAETALTTNGDTDPGTRSVLLLEDVELDAGDEPVLLGVEAGDRPGQIGIDGVRAAAFSAVVLPPDGGDPAAAEETTTTVGPPPDTVRPAIGVGHLPLPLDSPIVTRVEALLPPGARIQSAEHTYVSTPNSNDDVVLDGEVDGIGYRIVIARGEHWQGAATPTPVAWGTVWVATATDETTSILARSSDGVGVHVSHSDPDGSAETPEALTAIAAQLVADPVVRSVAAGGDPRGS